MIVMVRSQEVAMMIEVRSKVVVYDGIGRWWLFMMIMVRR